MVHIMVASHLGPQAIKQLKNITLFHVNDVKLLFFSEICTSLTPEVMGCKPFRGHFGLSVQNIFPNEKSWGSSRVLFLFYFFYT